MFAESDARNQKDYEVNDDGNLKMYTMMLLMKWFLLKQFHGNIGHHIMDMVVDARDRNGEES